MKIRDHVAGWLQRLTRVAASPILGSSTKDLKAEMLALHALLPIANRFTRYLPWNTVALHPRGLAAVLNDVTMHKRQLTVECGAGLSTLFLAQILRDQGGRLISIEQDPEWASQIRAILEAERLAGPVTVVTAPLAASDLSLDGEPWYDTRVLSECLAPDERIDLLLVDGPVSPPPSEGALVRYPALPFFRPWLAEAFTVVLDDGHRHGERTVLQHWEREFQLSFELRGEAAFATVGSPLKIWL